MEIPKEIQDQVTQELNSIGKAVTLKVFTGEQNASYCKETLELTNAMASWVEKLKVEEYNIEENKDIAEKYQVENTPTILIHSESKEWPIRFNGIPAGYEFSSLIESIKFAGTEDLELDEEITKKLKTIDKEIDIKVFVTISCPYCPPAVMNAFKFAMTNPEKIKAQMYEASEFPELAEKYSVRAVPRIVINDDIAIEGSLPVDKYLEKILEA